MFEYLVAFGLLSGHEASVTTECRLIKNDTERLACYDSAFGHPSARAAVPNTVKQPREVAATAEDFGLTEEQRKQKQHDDAPAIDMIESRVITIERHPRDRFTLTLENGQKWMQIEPTPIQRFRVGDMITIRRAAFNSYLARGPDSDAGYRVRRVD